MPKSQHACDGRSALRLGVEQLKSFVVFKLFLANGLLLPHPRTLTRTRGGIFPTFTPHFTVPFLDSGLTAVQTASKGLANGVVCMV